MYSLDTCVAASHNTSLATQSKSGKGSFKGVTCQLKAFSNVFWTEVSSQTYRLIDCLDISEWILLRKRISQRFHYSKPLKSFEDAPRLFKQYCHMPCGCYLAVPSLEGQTLRIPFCYLATWTRDSAAMHVSWLQGGPCSPFSSLQRKIPNVLMKSGILLLKQPFLSGYKHLYVIPMADKHPISMSFVYVFFPSTASIRWMCFR